MLRIFIGYDAREPVAYHVLAHSLLRRATAPVSVTPLVLDHLRTSHARGREPGASTDFSLTRFLVPFLCGYDGLAIYMDCDMLCRTDIDDLLGWVDVRADVGVCQHAAYTPKAGVKFLGQAQAAYPRKNWSSLMVFDTARCRALTPEYVNTASAADLHRFAWAARVGEIPVTYNWLVGEYPPNPHAKILHYTLGGPWFSATKDCEHADLWLAEKAHMEAVGG